MLAAANEIEVCREHLGSLLTEEVDSLRELEDVLVREHDVLGAKNVAAIERTALVRAQMMGDLARTEEHLCPICKIGHMHLIPSRSTPPLASTTARRPAPLDSS